LLAKFILSSLAALALVACAPPKDDIVIAGNSWLGATPFYAFEAVSPEQMPDRLRTVMLVSDVSVMRMLGNGGISGAFVTLDNALIANTLSGGDYCVAMVIDRSTGADAVVARPGWQPESGVPIRVGLEDSTIARYMLERWQNAAQLDGADVQPQVLLPTQHLAAMKTQSVDVIISYEPFITRLKQLNGRVLFDSRADDVDVLDVLIVRKEVFAAEPRQIIALREQVWPLILARMQEGEAAFWSALSQLSGLSADALSRTLAAIEFVPMERQEEALEQLITTAMPATINYLIANNVHDHVEPLSICEARQ
jgi:NitT/TauT family transport system substrate-binding protein